MSRYYLLLAYFWMNNSMAILETYMCIVVDICTSNALTIMHMFENEGSQDKSTKYVNNMTHQWQCIFSKNAGELSSFY